MKARTLHPLSLIPAALLLGAGFMSGRHNSQPTQGTPITSASTQAAPSVLVQPVSNVRPVVSTAETYVELDLSQGKGTFNEWIIVPSSNLAILTNNQIETVGVLKPGDRIRLSGNLTGRVTTARPHVSSPQPASSVKTPPGTVASRAIGKTERSTDTLLYLTTREEVVKTTPEHPFSVAGKGWVPAGQLKPGDALETEDGTTVPVVSTEQRHEPTTVYNLRIEGTENFFVGKGRLLVHNGGPCVPRLLNPFDGKTATEIDDMLISKGYSRRGPDPVNGLGGYVNPRSGRSIHIDPANSFGEPPHVDINRLRSYDGPLPKRKYPFGP